MIQHLCEKQLLLSQKELVMATNQLLLLNPVAKGLILQKKATEKALQLAPPPLKPKFLALLLVIKAKMTKLRHQQESIVRNSEIYSQIHLSQLQKKTHESTLSWRKTWNQSKGLLHQLRLPNPKLMLKKVYWDRQLPFYEVPLNYGQVQTLTAEMLWTGRTLLPTWLEFLSTSHFRWQETCSSHPHKGGFQWVEHLGTDKSYWKHSYF